MSTWKEMSDEQLALLYADGNNKAFDILLSRVQDKLFSYIFCMVKNEELANDLFQETFIKAIMKIRDGKYKDNGKFLFWITRIAHNVIIDQFRDLKNSHIVDAPKENDLGNLRSDAVLESDHEKTLVNEQVMKDVRQLMEALPDVQREVVYMRYFQEMSFKDIAKTTGVSINTSLGRMRYALINLRRLSKEHNVELHLV
jgi:RNA polymerase sigma-70 factor (ECF subfamily)